MKKQDALKKIEELNQIQQIEGIESNFNRSRSITVGTSFGGTTEITMRGNGDRFLYSIMQPVEVLELIHQLAANVGCHIAIKPRNDFGSWREWRVSEAEKKHLGVHPPFVNDMAVFQKLGMQGFNQELAEATMENWLSHSEYDYSNGHGAQIKKQPQKQKLHAKKNIKQKISNE